MLLVFKTAPFIDDVDDWLSFMTSLQMMLTLLAGFALLTDNKDGAGKEYDSVSVGSVLVVINSFALVFLVVSVFALIPCIRTKINRCGSGKKGSYPTKVIPTRKKVKSEELSEEVREWK